MNLRQDRPAGQAERVRLAFWQSVDRLVCDADDHNQAIEARREASLRFREWRDDYRSRGGPDPSAFVGDDMAEDDRNETIMWALAVERGDPGALDNLRAHLEHEPEIPDPPTEWHKLDRAPDVRATARRARAAAAKLLATDDGRDGDGDGVGGFRMLEEWDDVLDAEGARSDWLWRGVFRSGWMPILVAPPKAGKSTLARCIAARVATGGGTFLGRELAGGRVLHLAIEESPETWMNHYRQLGVLDCPDLFVRRGFLPPGRGLDVLARAVREYRPALVIIDTLGRFAPVEDSSAYGQVGSALDPLLQLTREEGFACLAIHHSRKGQPGDGDTDTQEVLGSQNYAATADVVMSIRRKRDGTRTLSATGRDGVNVRETVLTLDEADGQIVSGGLMTDRRKHDRAREIADWIREQSGPVSSADVLRALPGNRNATFAALRKLVDSGEIARTGKGPATRYSPQPDDGESVSVSVSLKGTDTDTDSGDSLFTRGSAPRPPSLEDDR